MVEVWIVKLFVFIRLFILVTIIHLKGVRFLLLAHFTHVWSSCSYDSKSWDSDEEKDVCFIRNLHLTISFWLLGTAFSINRHRNRMSAVSFALFTSFLEICTRFSDSLSAFYNLGIVRAAFTIQTQERLIWNVFWFLVWMKINKIILLRIKTQKEKESKRTERCEQSKR